MRWKNIVFNVSFALNCLLAFLLFFSSELVVPEWLQVGGRLHPVILHFPIVIIVLYVLWLLFAPRHNEYYKDIAETLLLLSAVTAVVTALCGLLLSKEPGYDADALQTHKYTGAATSFLFIIWYWISTSVKWNSWLNIATSFVLLLLVTVAGDLGGDITHGDNFVLAPLVPVKQKQAVAFEDAFVYADLVQPVLESKCMGCHNNKKAKGELIMETTDLLLKGGKDGKLWDTTQADLGLMMRRIHLPEDAKEHMPPTGKTQLTDEEILILHQWIKDGADFTKKVTDLLPSDTLHVIAARKLKSNGDEQYNFAAADESTIQKLSNSNRVIYPVALESPALVVNFYNKPFYNSKQLQELNEIKQQIVELNLSKMPVTDDDVKTIAGFTNLRILNLNYSAITGATLSELKKIPTLKSLSLVGTQVKEQQVAALQSFPKLKTVFIWNTAVDTTALAKLERDSKIHFETGYKGDTVMLKLTPPVVLNGDSVITPPALVRLKHYINGTTIRYTVDGNDPDSTTSTIYNNDLTINKPFLLKARAVKNGWYSSDVISRYFFLSKYEPDSVQLLTKPNDRFLAKGGATLADLGKSDFATATGNWLGYRETNCEAIFYYNKPIKASSVTLSIQQNIGGYIMPPESVEVWGGTNKNNMKLLGKTTPKQPTKIDDAFGNIGVECNFPTAEVSCIKLVAKPVEHLPKWHPGKGEKGWIFIDEVLVN